MQEVTITKKKSAQSTLKFNDDDKSTGVIISQSGKRMEANGGNAVRGTVSRTKGKWYFEFKVVQVESGLGGNSPVVAIATTATQLQNSWNKGLQQVTWFCGAGNPPQLIYGNAQPRPSYGTSFINSGNVGVALDMDNRKLEFYNNGVPMGVINLDTYTNGTEFYPFASSPNSGGSNTIVDLYAGKDLFYPIPAGYSAW